VTLAERPLLRRSATSSESDLVPMSDRLPDKITGPLSATWRCQNLASYRWDEIVSAPPLT